MVAEAVFLTILVAMSGCYVTWKWGEKMYHEGIVYALSNHYEGTLEYKVYIDEDGEEVLEIKTTEYE